MIDELTKIHRRMRLRRRARVIGWFVAWEAAVVGFVGGVLGFLLWTPTPWLLLAAGLSSMAAAVFWSLTWGE